MAFQKVIPYSDLVPAKFSKNLCFGQFETIIFGLVFSSNFFPFILSPGNLQDISNNPCNFWKFILLSGPVLAEIWKLPHSDWILF